MMLLNAVIAEASIGGNLATALTSEKLWVNIAQTVIFILLGFFFTKKKLLPDKTGKILTKFVMSVCLPCLAFCSFMSDFTVSGGIDALVNFILGFVFYIGFIFLAKLIFIWVKDRKKRTVLSVLFAFGSTTFFGYPLVVAIYGGTAGNNFNIMNVAYRVFLYSYAYLAVANLEDETSPEADASSLGHEDKPVVDKSVKSILKKVFLNPIVIATFAGLLLWVLQAIPGTAIVNKNVFGAYPSTSPDAKVAFWRFDATLPWFYQAANKLGGLSSTIILFAIGCTLGGTNIKDAATDKYAWIWTAIKVVVAPAIVLGVLLAMQSIANATGFLTNATGALKDGAPEYAKNVSQLVSVNILSSVVITWMVPPATVAVGYCINFDKEKEMASHISLIGTFGSVIGIVIWVIVLTVLTSSGLFYDPSWFVAA